MKLTLMIEGSATALATILANLPPDVTGGIMPEIIGGGAPILPGGEDDDSGPVDAAAPLFDNTGLPWDERIHSATKTRNADGSWKKRRGGPTGEALTAIETELRMRTAAQAQQPAPVPQPQPIAQPVPMPQPVPVAQPQPIPQPVPQPVPQPQPVPVAQPMPEQVQQPAPQPMPAAQQVVEQQPAMATQPLDFMGFMTHIQQQTTKQDANGAPLIHTDYLAQLTKRVSDAYQPQGYPALTAITDIGAYPFMIEYATGLIKADGRW